MSKIKNEPENQSQHRISQVYLKQFGYKKNEKWWLSICPVGNEVSENVLIEKFLAEINLFDLPYSNPEERRFFENISGVFENEYPTIISNLQNQKRLTEKDNYFLCYYVANLLCRSKPFRIYIDNLLSNPDTADKMIEEITIFTSNSRNVKTVLETFSKDFHLDVIICNVMHHIALVLQYFSQTIVQNLNEKDFFTSDNPVVLDRQGNYERIIPIEAEIYLPLSKEFCLFMFFDKSPLQENKLRKLKLDRINLVDLLTLQEITKKILLNSYEYLIIPGEFAWCVDTSNS